MKAKLVRHDKITDAYGNTVEMKMWAVPKTREKAITGITKSVKNLICS